MAGSYFALGDFWFGRTFGIGAELHRAGRVGPDGSGSLSAALGRVALRFPVTPTNFVVTSAALGYGHGTRTTNSSDPECGAGGYGCTNPSDPGSTTQTFSHLSGAFALEYRVQIDNLALACALRVAFVGPEVAVTMGPSIGFGL